MCLAQNLRQTPEELRPESHTYSFLSPLYNSDQGQLQPTGYWLLFLPAAPWIQEAQRIWEADGTYMLVKKLATSPSEYTFFGDRTSDPAESQLWGWEAQNS